MAKSKKGLFITFEGGEGAGKTTLINSLKQELSKAGYPAIVTREPGGTPLGEQIRNMLLHPSSFICPDAELLLFLASRAQHLAQVIRPKLEEGVTILCDRFNDSTIAYQGIARMLGKQKVENLCKIVCADLEPDITFFLDIDPKEGLERSRRTHKEHAAEGILDRIESEERNFHNLVRKGLQQLAKENPERIKILNAAKPALEVFAEAFDILKIMLP